MTHDSELHDVLNITENEGPQASEYKYSEDKCLFVDLIKIKREMMRAASREIFDSVVINALSGRDKG